MPSKRVSTSPSRDLPIGIFDSGLGGLTVVRAVHQLMPHEDLIYLGDTARVPYGTKSPATVTRFACEDTRFLIDQKVKAVVVACNSATAWGLPTLEQQFDLPVMGVIEPGAEAALAATRNQRIGVIGTNATIRSQAYHRSIQSRCDTAKVFARPTPLLVPLVEEGWTNREVTLEVLREYLGPLLKNRIDTLVLGCTHYPLLKPALRKVVGRGVTLVDSADTCARAVREKLGALKLLATDRRRRGWIRPCVTDEPERFGDFAKRFLGVKTERPSRVELPTVAVGSCSRLAC
jgi:glutamate racemase